MKRLGVIALVLLSVLLAAVAFAAEGGHGEAHGHGGIPVAKLLFSTINLGIFVFILSRFAMPQIRLWVRERRQYVVTALDEAAAAKREAERLRAEWEQRLASFENEVEQLRAQARRDAERERDRILASARKTAETIQRDAERAAAYEQRRAREELRDKIVRQAIVLAEKQTHERWTTTDQDRSVAEFVKQVGA
jgi:F-type H+-transporting ATPase subunit b